MPRITGTYRTSTTAGESVQAFVPHPLPPVDPALRTDGDIDRLHAEALTGLARLEVAGRMVPSTGWFLYGFVRKEAVITSQIEGTQRRCAKWSRSRRPRRPSGRTMSRRSATTLRRSGMRGPRWPARRGCP